LDWSEDHPDLRAGGAPHERGCDRGASFSRKRVFSLDLAPLEGCRGGGLQSTTLIKGAALKESHDS